MLSIKHYDYTLLCVFIYILRGFALILRVIKLIIGIITVVISNTNRVIEILFRMHYFF